MPYFDVLQSRLKKYFEEKNELEPGTLQTPIDRGLNEAVPVTEPEKVILSAATNIASGIGQIIGMPIDWVNQNLISPDEDVSDESVLKAINEVWPTVTPDTTVGEISSLLVQYGIPFSGAVKVAGPLVKLQKVRAKDFVTPGKRLFAAGNTAKGAFFYGGIGGLTDFVVSNAGVNKSIISQYTGDTDVDRNDPADVFKEKLKFGAEGTAIGLVPSLLPAAGAGVKYGLWKGIDSPVGRIGIQPTIKTLSDQVGAPVLRQLDQKVLNPVFEALASEKVGISKGLRKVRDKFQLYTKDVPKYEEWRMFDPNSTNKTQRYLKKLDNFLNYFRSNKELTPSAAALVRDADKATQLDIRTADKLLNQIDKKVYDLGVQFKNNMFDKGQSELIMNNAKENIFNFLKGTGDLKVVEKALRPEAIKLKKLLKILNKQYGEALDPKVTNELGETIIQDMDSYLKQSFSSFYNKNYKISSDVRQRAVEGFKKLIMAPGNGLLKGQVYDRMGGIVAGARTSKFADNAPEFQKALNDLAEDMVDDVLIRTKDTKYSPDQIIRGISKDILKMDKKVLRPGEKFPDFMRELLGETKDLRNSVMNTVIQNSKAIYNKRLYDELVNDGLKNKWLFESPEQAALPIAKGGIAMKNASGRLQQIKRTKDQLFQSKMFGDQRQIGTGQYYSTPEIVNAIEKNIDVSVGLMDQAWYKALMTLKSGAQFSKTVLSPMTQIRNVTSASMFATANGLIGGRANILDSFKLIAKDIAGTDGVIDARKFQEVIDDKIARGVLDENVVTQELKAVLDKANKDSFGNTEQFFDFLMRNKFMRSATDLYQGGDNVWKSYADDFYQSALTPAIKSIDDVRAWFKDIAGTEWAETSLRTNKIKTVEEGIKDISAYLVTNTMPTYSRVPRIIEKIRTLPLGNFIAFPAEMFRTSMNITMLGAKEMTSKNPYIRQMGARRLVGLMGTTYGAGKVTEEAAKFVTKVTEEELEAFRRSFAPYYEKNSQLIPTSSINADGTFDYVNYSYFNPYDTISRPVRAVFNAVASGKITDRSAIESAVLGAFFYDPTTGTPGALYEIFSPFVGESIATERVLDIGLRGGQTRTGKKIFTTGVDSGPDIAAKSLNHIFGALEPGAFRSAKRIYDGYMGNYSDYGTLYDGQQELTALLTGQRIQKANPASSMPFIVNSYNKDKSAINRSLSGPLYSSSNTLKDKIEHYRKMSKVSFASQKKLRQVLKDAETLGLNAGSKFEDVLKKRLTKSESRSIITGSYKPLTISEDRIKGAIERMEDEALRVQGAFPDPEKLRALQELEDTIKSIQSDAKGFSLDQSVEEFDESLDTNIDFLLQLEDQGPTFLQDQSSAPSKPDLGPGITQDIPPSQQVVNVVNPLQGILPTGLTRTETALLSPSEQAIRLRQRGLS
jgi:hypothetical protein